jgi:hypothetical protein
MNPVSTDSGEWDAKAKAVYEAAKALEAAILANATDTANRHHAIALLGDVLHCAYYAITETAREKGSTNEREPIKGASAIQHA